MSRSDPADLTDREARDRALFERVAGEYHRKDLLPAHRRARRHRLMQTLRLVILPAESSILEVGCGAGFAADYLKGRYGRFLGIDYSRELIGYARHYNAGPGVSFEACNVNDFDSEPRFDLVLMIGLLHHLDDPVRTLTKTAAYLKPGGWVVANEPQSGNPLFQAARKIRMNLDPHYSDEQAQYDRRQLAEMFHQSGLGDVRIRPQGLFSTPMAEVALPLQEVMEPISACLCALDGAIERLLADRIAWPFWNLIVAGRRPAAG